MGILGVKYAARNVNTGEVQVDKVFAQVVMRGFEKKDVDRVTWRKCLVWYCVNSKIGSNTNSINTWGDETYLPYWMYYFGYLSEKMIRSGT